MRKELKKVTGILTLAALITSGINTDVKNVRAESKANYPWSVTSTDTTGNYITDSYGIKAEENVVRELTEERLLDLVNSKGDYYIVFGGPEKETSKSFVPELSKQAKEAGVKEVYEFDPVIDGYQLDITDKDSPFYGNYSTVTGSDGTRSLEKNSVYKIWESVVSYFPEGTFTDYTSKDTLAVLLHNDGNKKTITDKVLVKDNEVKNVNVSDEVKELIRGGNKEGSVVVGDTRSDFDYYKKVWNASGSYIENTRYEAAALKAQVDSGKRIGTDVELFSDSDKEGFALRQVTFRELVNILNSPGDHDIFFALSWCHNTQAIINSVQQKAKANGKTVYVYDPQIGNQLTWNEDYTRVTGISSTYNSRTSVTGSVKLGDVTSDAAKGSNNISYLYGELVRNYFGNFITENNTKKNNSISYYPNGNIEGEATTVLPWESSEGVISNAIRLQVPFLFEYNKNATNKITKQWLHKNSANDGTYTEFMLELAWVRATDSAKAYSDKQKEALSKTEDKRTDEEKDYVKGTIDGLTYVEFGQEALKELSTVLGEKEPTSTSEADNPGSTEEKKDDSTPGSTTVKAPKAPKFSSVKAGKKKVTLTWKKVSGANGYEIYSATKKKGKYKKVTTIKKQKTVKYVVKKLKKKKTYYFKIRSYVNNGSKKKYSAYSAVKKAKVK